MTAPPTPALMLDGDALDRNIATMARRAQGVSLRPHAKSHKSAFIARRQIAAGAAGVCCAKLAEAEALADAGIADILITSPVIGADNAARAGALARRIALAVVIDHDMAAPDLAAHAPGLRVVIDVDVGLGRTGVAAPQQAVAVARAAAAAGLRVDGVQAYGGSWQHIAGAETRAAAMRAGMVRAQEAVAALRAEGFAVTRITGGGTGTATADLALGFLTELQPGSYVFMDRQYRDALGGDADGAFEQSLFVASRVISINAPDWVTIDAGIKAFSTDAGLPAIAEPRWAGSRYFFFGDEHGGVTRPEGAPVSLGERILLIPPHCDPTVNLYDRYRLLRGGAWAGEAPIEARGRGW
jgi:D-serine deaminase-like pyridoxal phosphate-dependent protein